MKDSNTHYHLSATTPEVFHFERDKQKQEAQLTLALNKFIVLIEKKVFQFPNQWFNYYNFWQTGKHGNSQ